MDQTDMNSMDQPAQTNQGKETPLAAPQELLQPLGPGLERSEPAQSCETDKQAASPVPTPSPVAADYHAKFAEEVHNYLREYIRNADQKAAFFFAGATALLAFLHRS